MSIRKKLTLGIILSLAVIILVLYGLLAQVFTRGFSTVEKIDAQQNIDRVVRAFETDVQTLNDIVVAWAQWDDAYEYLLGKNPAFIQKNVTPETFDSIKVNILCFVDKTGKIAYQGAYDSTAGLTAVPDSFQELFAPGSYLLQHKGSEDIKKGFLFLKGKPYLVAVSPVVNSNADSDIAGTMAAFRLFDESQIQHLSEITKLKLAFARATSTATGGSIRPLNEEVLLAETTIQDVFGKDSLSVSIEIPRLVYKQGKTTVHYLLICLVGMGCVLVLIIAALIHTIVIRRIRKLSLEVAQRRDSLEFGTPVTCSGKDEIGSLARTINGMLAHVNEVLQKLSQ